MIKYNNDHGIKPVGALSTAYTIGYYIISRIISYTPYTLLYPILLILYYIYPI